MLPLRVVAVLLLAALSGCTITPSLAFENTIRVIVDPSRQWQCGDGFFPNGGSERYQFIRVLTQGELLGTFDLANPSDCTKVLEYLVDLPNGISQLTQIEVGGYTMDATITGADRNRVWTLNAFVDSFWGELTEDYVADRQAGSPATAPVPNGHTQTIELQVAPDRVWQCGVNFYANGGSDGYRFARLLVDSEEVARYDFAAEEDCSRIVSVVRELPNNGQATVTLEVGPYVMTATLTAPDWPRIWRVYFFVDQIWGEVHKDLIN
jgi:hypothetical protein